MGLGLLGRESYKFVGSLDNDTSSDVKDNLLYNATETDKNKIEYYPMSVIADDYGVKLAQRLYFRQDTHTDPIDILADDSQYTFVSLPEYTFVPSKNYYRDPQK